MMSFMQDDTLSAHVLTSGSITLTPAQVTQAIELAHQASTEVEQWQTYLNSLALLGLQEWLAKRSPEIKIESDFLQAEDLRGAAPELNQTGLSQAVSQIQIARSRLHLLITDCLADPLVGVPKLDAADRPDFYLLVEVLEELSEVRIQGYLPQAKFNLAQLEAQFALPQAADLRFLPIQAFADPAGLLLQLRAQLSAAPIQQSAQPPVQQPVQPPKVSLAPPNLINLRLWLQGRLDEVAESLSWHLLPPAALNLSGAMMGGADLLNAVLRELQGTQGIAIPTSARAAERDLELEEVRLKLYVLTWEPAPDQWSLLLILGAQSGALPVGLTLKVEANQELLSEQRLSDQPYLYNWLVGAPDEQFRVTVTAPTGAALTLTPFGFAPSKQPSEYPSE